MFNFVFTRSYRGLKFCWHSTDSRCFCSHLPLFLLKFSSMFFYNMLKWLTLQFLVLHLARRVTELFDPMPWLIFALIFFQITISLSSMAPNMHLYPFWFIFQEVRKRSCSDNCDKLKNRASCIFVMFKGLLYFKFCRLFAKFSIILFIKSFRYIETFHCQ